MTRTQQLFNELKQSLHKNAFVPSQQTQEAVAAAQQAGAIPPPDPAQQQQQVDPVIQELAAMMQEGFNAVLQGQQQLIQFVQQQAAQGAQGQQGQKKPSVSERLDMIEQALSQMMQGAGGAPPPPEDVAAAQAPAPGQPPVA